MHTNGDLPRRVSVPDLEALTAQTPLLVGVTGVHVISTVHVPVLDPLGRIIAYQTIVTSSETTASNELPFIWTPLAPAIDSFQANGAATSTVQPGISTMIAWSVRHVSHLYQ